MRRVNSKDYPPKYIDLGRTKQVNYNVTQREDEMGDVTYDYFCIIVDSFTFPDIVRGLMLEKYMLEDEIALINNYNLDPVKYGQEYQDYQDYRLVCKNTAKALVG